MTQHLLHPSPVFQYHSETSKAAAQIDRRGLRERIYNLIQMTGIHGMTGNEIAHQLNIGPNSASGRLRELQGLGKIRKSPDRRAHHIRPGRKVESNVWKLPEFVPVEADTKRDKAKEALALVKTMKGNKPCLEVLMYLNQIEDVLK